MNRTFHVKPVWDNEAKVFFALTDIIGLHIEAATLAEFDALVSDLAAELIVANHLSARDIAETPLKDLLPAIVLQQPDPYKVPA